jgi:hypothetical protein
MKKPIHYIVVHCTAAHPENVIESIKEYWRKEQPFTHPGYHLIIKRSGEVETLLLEDISTKK